MSRNKKASGFKLGLFGIGLDAYWPQFEGLKERLEGYLDILEKRFQSMDATTVNLGLVDTVDKAFAAGKEFRQEDVDIIFIYVTTYVIYCTTSCSKGKMSCFYFKSFSGSFNQLCIFQ